MSGQTLAALAVAVALGGCTSAEQPGETLADDPEPGGDCPQGGGGSMEERDPRLGHQGPAKEA